MGYVLLLPFYFFAILGVEKFLHVIIFVGYMNYKTNELTNVNFPNYVCTVHYQVNSEN